MQIRKKLTYQFIGIVSIIMIVSSVSIYYFSADYRKVDFYNRLMSRANRTAKLLIETEDIDSNLLARIDKNNPIKLTKEKIIVINYQDKILYSTDKEKTIGINKELLDNIRLNKNIHYRQGEFEILGILYAYQYDRVVVIAGAVDDFGLKLLKNLRTVLIIVFILGIILTLLAGWIYAGRALNPISKVIKQVENITITSLNLRVDKGNGEDEIAKLAITFNNMLERLETAFNTQKNFISNASHELRTPLTLITGQIEVILMKKRNNEEYQETLVSLLEDMKNINSISDRLLLMAQASSDNANIGISVLRIDDIIWQTRAELLKRNNNYKIIVDFDPSIDDDLKLNTTGNEQLLKTALTNLIDNGCKYSNNHLVEVTISYKDKFIQISFADHGIGIEKTDLNHIFEPFYRGKNTISIEGHGIGLSLVEKIINLHKGTIKVISELNIGTTFFITLPS